jgi:hypothetical protein
VPGSQMQQIHCWCQHFGTAVGLMGHLFYVSFLSRNDQKLELYTVYYNVACALDGVTTNTSHTTPRHGCSDGLMTSCGWSTGSVGSPPQERRSSTATGAPLFLGTTLFHSVTHVELLFGVSDRDSCCCHTSTCVFVALSRALSALIIHTSRSPSFAPLSFLASKLVRCSQPTIPPPHLCVCVCVCVNTH